MIWEKNIIGQYVELRYARIEDASAILSIRQDESLTKFLPRLDITINQQEDWLRIQQDREGDYYFIVWKNGEAIGTVRIYDILGNEGETGSIAIRGSIIEKMEAKLLLDTFIFESLGLERIHNIVRIDNSPIIKFSELFGVKWNGTAIDRNGYLCLTGYNTKERSREYRLRIAESLYLQEEKNDVKIDYSAIPAIEERINNILSKSIHGIDFFNENKLISDGIIDSLGMMTMLAVIEDEFNCKIPFKYVNKDNFDNTRSIAELISSLEFRLKKEYGLTNNTNNCDASILNSQLLDLEINDTKKTVVERILNYARIAPNSVSIIANDKETTFKELANKIFSIYDWLKRRDIKKGDRIIIQALHEDTCIACYYAIHLIGAILVPVEKTASTIRISEIADDTEAKLIVSIQTINDSDKWYDYEQLRKVATEREYTFDNNIVFPDLDSPCEMIFTTGTTGKSKGVLMTHRHISWYAYAIAKELKMKNNNRFLLTTPLNHAGGLRRTHLSLANGCCMVYMDGISDFEKYFSYIEKYRVTSLYLPPVAIRILLSRTGDELAKYKNQIDFVYSSSSPLPIGDCKELIKLLPNTRLYNAYEASETPGVSMYDYNCESIDNTCMGKPNEGVLFAIIDDEGNFVDKNNYQGQICVKSKMNMKEYYNSLELTKSVMKDGWFISNDLGFIDADGQLHYSGRKGDVINIGGYKIAPTDVEDVALLSGMIDECVCIESVDELNVPCLKLLIVSREGNHFDTKALIDFMKERIEAYKIPKIINSVSAINRTFNGKIDRKSYKT